MNTEITYIRLINRVYIKEEQALRVWEVFLKYGIEIVIGSSCYVNKLPYIDRVYLLRGSRISISNFKIMLNEILDSLVKYNKITYMQFAIEYEIAEKAFISDLVYMDINKVNNIINYNVLIEKIVELSPGQQSIKDMDTLPMGVLFNSH